MDTWIWVVIAAAIVLVVLLLAISARRRRRTARLRTGFGPEYDHTLEERGGRRAAEAELIEREERHSRFELRPLSASARERYATAWTETQRRFVDDPVGAIGEGDRLVSSLMAERGYPVEDFEQRAADVSVEHPHVVSNFRAAHDISERSARNAATTEELRRAMLHYRSLFDELLESETNERADAEPAPVAPEPVEEQDRREVAPQRP